MKKAKLGLIGSMVIFGTIGLFVRWIPLPSSLIAGVRGLVGMLFLLVFLAIRGQKLSWGNIRKNLLVLLFSGAALGSNWVLLFEAYEYTTVATATLCYYMAPVLVILISPLLLKEKLTSRKLTCAAIALVGSICISGVLQNLTGDSAGGQMSNGAADYAGILFGLGAACLYATVMLLNKRLRGVSAFDRTVIQLGASAAVMVPYVLLTENIGSLTATPSVLGLLILVGILHTGIAYAMYFSAMEQLPAQTIAIFSYLDPVVAILLSALVLREGMGLVTGIGAILILGSALISELPEHGKNRN